MPTRQDSASGEQLINSRFASWTLSGPLVAMNGSAERSPKRARLDEPAHDAVDDRAPAQPPAPAAPSDEEDDEDDWRNGAAMAGPVGAKDLYLDTVRRPLPRAHADPTQIRRPLLDFDFERLCSGADQAEAERADARSLAFDEQCLCLPGCPCRLFAAHSDHRSAASSSRGAARARTRMRTRSMRTTTSSSTWTHSRCAALVSGPSDRPGLHPTRRIRGQ